MLLGRRLSADAVLQFVQSQGEFTAAPFFCASLSPAADGEKTGDLPEKRSQRRRAFGGNGVPGSQVCVTDTFLRVLGVCKNVVGNMVAVASIFSVSLGNGLLRPGKLEAEDLRIFQWDALLSVFHFYTRKAEGNLADFLKKYIEKNS